MNNLTHLSLFSGIGGLDLAAEWAGFKSVGQCEWADYPSAILEKHWPDVPRWRDIRTLTKESFYERTGLRTVDIISGGFPCQPFSVAGQRRGKEDDRYLWPEMLRVIQELRPNWVVGENVTGIISMALDEVLSDMEALGYACQALIIPACGVDAPHRRYRVAIVAHDDRRSSWKETLQSGRKTVNNDIRGEVRRCSIDTGICGMADGLSGEIHRTDSYSTCFGLQRGSSEPDISAPEREREKVPRPADGIGGTVPFGETWLSEPDVGRVVNGLPDRVDRIKCLGNAVVPQQFYPIFKAIADIERQNYEHSL